MSIVSSFKLSEIENGQSFKFEDAVTSDMIDKFALLSGDVSPLHMDRNFAVSRGFNDRVVHGALLICFVSRLIGVHLPGENCLLHTINLSFFGPAYPDDIIQTVGTVDQVSFGTRTIVIRVMLTKVNSGILIAKGKVSLSFTDLV